MDLHYQHLHHESAEFHQVSSWEHWCMWDAILEVQGVILPRRRLVLGLHSPSNEPGCSSRYVCKGSKGRFVGRDDMRNGWYHPSEELVYRSLELVYRSLELVYRSVKQRLWHRHQLQIAVGDSSNRSVAVGGVFACGQLWQGLLGTMKRHHRRSVVRWSILHVSVRFGGGGRGRTGRERG